VTPERGGEHRPASGFRGNGRHDIVAPLVPGDREMLMEQKRSDDKPGDAVQEVLFRELHHRFYNSLQAISFMAGTAARSGPTPEMLRALQDRIAAFARIHRLLSEPVETNGQLAPACEELCTNLLQAFDRAETRVEIRMEPFRGDSMIGRAILLLIVELVTNALKHARRGERQRIALTLCAVENGLELMVANTGSGAASSIAVRPVMAKCLARSLGGTLSVHMGADFEVRVTLPHYRIASLISGPRRWLRPATAEGFSA
jgi:two-component sensor histidine kinase